MKNDDSIGDRFQELRKKKYDSQEEFSIAAECSRVYVSNMETTKSDPSLSMLKKSAKALDMPTWQLVKQLLNE